METKLPRAVLGVLVGVAFGVGGAIFQTTLRNPLASPDIIGVSFGASPCDVIAIVTFGLSGTPVALAAVFGVLAVALVVGLVAGPATDVSDRQCTWKGKSVSVGVGTGG